MRPRGLLRAESLSGLPTGLRAVVRGGQRSLGGAWVTQVLALDLANLGGEPILDEVGHQVAVLAVSVVHTDDRVAACLGPQVGTRARRRRAAALRLRRVGPIAEGGDVLHHL